MTCRCRDLRRALLGLVRAIKREREDSAEAAVLRPEQDTIWPKGFNFEALERADENAMFSDRALRISIRRARRLLRETRKQPSEPNATEALSRIMAAWCAYDDALFAPSENDSIRSKDELLHVLRCVAAAVIERCAVPCCAARQGSPAS